MKSITSIFKEIDNTLKFCEEYSKKLNYNCWHPTFSITHNPKDKPYRVCDENLNVWEMSERDHNGAFKVFLFKTTDVYGDYRGPCENEKKRILETSELRKPFYNEDGVEVGLTIENTIKDPNEIIYGFTFSGYQYYIIKNGELTITHRRSIIRKIFNNKDTFDEKYLIKFDFRHLEFFTGEIFEIEEVFDKIYIANIEDEHYLLADYDDLWEWVYETYRDEQMYSWWTEQLGGVNGLVEFILTNRSFNMETYLKFNFNLKNLLPVDVKEDVDMNYVPSVAHSTYDTTGELRLSGLNIFKIEY